MPAFRVLVGSETWAMKAEDLARLGQRCSKENVEELCQGGHEGYGLCLIETILRKLIKFNNYCKINNIISQSRLSRSIDSVTQV